MHFDLLPYNHALDYVPKSHPQWEKSEFLQPNFWKDDRYSEPKKVEKQTPKSKKYEIRII